jgi:hypothetical protein
MGNFRVAKNRPNGAAIAPARATVLEALRTLSAVLSTAEEDGLIPSNPARRMGQNLADTEAFEAREVEILSVDNIKSISSPGRGRRALTAGWLAPREPRVAHR